MKKYNQEKSITLDEVLKAGIQLSNEVICAWADRFGFYQVINWSQSKFFRDFAGETLVKQEIFQPTVLGQLIAYGFLTEIKEEKTYDIGQCFEAPAVGNIYMVVHTGDSRVMLVNVQTGNCWNGKLVKVDNVSKITQAEIDQLKTPILGDLIPVTKSVSIETVKGGK